MKTRLWLALGLLTLVVGLAVVSLATGKPADTGPAAARRRELPIQKGGDSRSFGLHTWDGNLDQRELVHIPPGERYKRVFALTHHASFPRDYVLVAMSGLRQHEMWIRGKRERRHVFHTPAGGTVEIPVELELPIGEHQVTFLVFKNPGDATATHEERRRIGGVAAVVRQKVVVGKGAPAGPWPPTPPLVTGSEAPGTGIEVSPGPDEARYWLWTEARAGATLPVYLHAMNGQGTESLLSIVAFLDWEQVDMTGTGSPLVAQLPAGTTAVWEYRLQVPSQPGLHEFQAVTLPIAGESGQPDERVEGSFRLGLDVKP